VTNLIRELCNVSVEWFLGFARDPICSSNFALDANVTAEFCTRDLPSFVSCDSTCEPPLEFGEGRAIVGADCNRLGLSGRVHYVTGLPEGQEENGLLAITDSKIVRVRTGKQATKHCPIMNRAPVSGHSCRPRADRSGPCSQYLLRQRIERARELLADPGRRVAEVRAKSSALRARAISPPSSARW
jgi:hypothetical protein